MWPVSGPTWVRGRAALFPPWRWFGRRPRRTSRSHG
jgi:hypothetical protein